MESIKIQTPEYSTALKLLTAWNQELKPQLLNTAKTFGPEIQQKIIKEVNACDLSLKLEPHLVSMVDSVNNLINNVKEKMAEQKALVIYQNQEDGKIELAEPETIQTRRESLGNEVFLPGEDSDMIIQATKNRQEQTLAELPFYQK